MAKKYDSKSAWARHQFDLGHTVAEVEKMSYDPKSGSLGPMGYSFLHGIAKRAGVKATGGPRTKAVSVTTEFVTIRCDSGVVIRVDRATGKIARKGAPTPVEVNS